MRKSVQWMPSSAKQRLHANTAWAESSSALRITLVMDILVILIIMLFHYYWSQYIDKIHVHVYSILNAYLWWEGETMLCELQKNSTVLIYVCSKISYNFTTSRSDIYANLISHILRYFQYMSKWTSNITNWWRQTYLIEKSNVSLQKNSRPKIKVYFICYVPCAGGPGGGDYCHIFGQMSRWDALIIYILYRKLLIECREYWNRPWRWTHITLTMWISLIYVDTTWMDRYHWSIQVNIANSVSEYQVTVCLDHL